jgi:hypothetical protein
VPAAIATNDVRSLSDTFSIHHTLPIDNNSARSNRTVIGTVTPVFVGLPLAFAAAKPELTDALPDKVALEKSL